MDNKWIIITGTSLFPDHKRQWIMCPYCKATYHIWMKNKRKCDICGNKVKGTITEEEYMKKENDDFSERVDDILRQMDVDYEPIKAIPSADKREYHIDHTDCIWYGSDSGCPVTCSQYRDGWNDAMDYIFKNGKGYQPYRHDG